MKEKLTRLFSKYLQLTQILHILHALNPKKLIEYNKLKNCKPMFYLRFFNFIIIKAGATKYIPRFNKMTPIP